MPGLHQFKPGPEPGSRFGKLTVVAPGVPVLESGRQWAATSICKCDCGKTVNIRNYVLTRKSHPAKSCGCTRKHGQAQRDKKNRTYLAWQNMKTRCRRDVHYEKVSIHPAWAKSFEQFARDMGECPEGLTLDRIDTKGNYEPGNCRWINMREQANNKINNRVVTVGDISMTVAEWMRLNGLHYTTFYRRLKLGWSEEKAATTPKHGRTK